MTKLTALELYVLTDTLGHSLAQDNYWTGSATKEAREGVFRKLQMILNDMSVEVSVNEAEEIENQ